ncbi:MAG: hypothetical protein ACOX79_00330 [Methanosarcina sp.]|jgi:hypothetical protein
MQKKDEFETNPEVIYLSEDSKTKNEEERTKLRNLGLKLKQRLIPESMNVPLFFSVPFLLLSLEALEANMKVYFPSNMKEKPIA